MHLAGEHALAEWRQANGNGLCDWGPICDTSSAVWRALPLPQQIAKHKLEYVLDQEQMRLLRMPPPPRLLRWVRASLEQPLPPPCAPEPENPLDSDDDEFEDVDELGDGTWASGVVGRAAGRLARGGAAAGLQLRALGAVAAARVHSVGRTLR